jgi:hypothetical protein
MWLLTHGETGKYSNYKILGYVTTEEEADAVRDKLGGDVDKQAVSPIQDRKMVYRVELVCEEGNWLSRDQMQIKKICFFSGDGDDAEFDSVKDEYTYLMKHINSVGNRYYLRVMAVSSEMARLEANSFLGLFWEMRKAELRAALEGAR